MVTKTLSQLDNRICGFCAKYKHSVTIGRPGLGVHRWPKKNFNKFMAIQNRFFPDLIHLMATDLDKISTANHLWPYNSFGQRKLFWELSFRFWTRSREAIEMYGKKVKIFFSFFFNLNQQKQSFKQCGYVFLILLCLIRLNLVTLIFWSKMFGQLCRAHVERCGTVPMKNMPLYRTFVVTNFSDKSWPN